MPAVTTEIVFYDGHCGLAHHAVRFLATIDRTGKKFRFAPSAGPTFQHLVDRVQAANLHDSMIVRTADGTLISGSNSWIYVLARLGGQWNWAAIFMKMVPRRLREALYQFVAQTRYWYFGRREHLYPAVSPDLRDRFDL